jgi:O-antigen/teichoic acid export membrane protein
VLARSAIVVLGWNMTRLLLQLLWVILIARSLGAGGYGEFSGVAGLAVVLSGFAGAGLGLRMYQDVARDRALFGLRWAQAQRALGWTGLLLALIFVGVSLIFFPAVSVVVLISVAIAELAAVPLVTNSANAWAAHGKMGLAALASVTLALARVAAVSAMIVVGTATLEFYSVLHLTFIGVAAAMVYIFCRRSLKPERSPAPIGWSDLREGIRLSSVWASTVALNSADKTLALHAGGADVAGAYTAANRFATLLAQPVEALVTVALPRLFRERYAQSKNSRLLVLLAATAILYGGIAGAILWQVAALLPMILGPEFTSAVRAAELLAFFVPAYCLRVVGANVLLGFGWTHWRVGCEVAALGMLIGLILWLTPAYGASGAALAVVATETVLALLLWARIIAGERSRLELSR